MFVCIGVSGFPIVEHFLINHDQQILVLHPFINLTLPLARCLVHKVTGVEVHCQKIFKFVITVLN